MAQAWLERALAAAWALRYSRWLGVFGTTVRQRRLWHLSRSGVARGAAIGVFCGVLFPLAQIPVAALIAVPARACIPVAAVSTLVTNPFTFPPLYYGAYRLGSRLTGEPPAPITPAHLEPDEQSLQGWRSVLGERVVGLGRPLAVGLAVFAVGGATLAYLLADCAWVVTTRARRRAGRGARR